MQEELNKQGAALTLTLARYFKSTGITFPG